MTYAIIYGHYNDYTQFMAQNIVVFTNTATGYYYEFMTRINKIIINNIK